MWDLAGGDGGWQLRQHGGDSGPETEVQSKDEEDKAQAGTWPGRSKSPASKLIVIQYGVTPCLETAILTEPSLLYIL